LKDASKAILEGTNILEDQGEEEQEHDSELSVDRVVKDEPSSSPRPPFEKDSVVKTWRFSRENMLIISDILYGYSLQEGNWGVLLPT